MSDIPDPKAKAEDTMIVCDKCKKPEVEDLSCGAGFRGLSNSKVYWIANTEATLCADCCNALADEMIHCFANFFGGIDNVDIVVDGDGGSSWGKRLRRTAMPSIRKLHPQASEENPSSRPAG